MDERPVVQFVEVVNGVEVSRQEAPATDDFLRELARITRK